MSPETGPGTVANPHTKNRLHGAHSPADGFLFVFAAGPVRPGSRGIAYCVSLLIAFNDSYITKGAYRRRYHRKRLPCRETLLCRML